MKNLTLVIPAKHEEFSLPKVLEEIKNFKCKKLIILGRSDTATIRSIRNYKCKIIKQKYNGYGNALIEGINNLKDILEQEKISVAVIVPEIYHSPELIQSLFECIKYGSLIGIKS